MTIALKDAQQNMRDAKDATHDAMLASNGIKTRMMAYIQDTDPDALDGDKLVQFAKDFKVAQAATDAAWKARDAAKAAVSTARDTAKPYRCYHCDRPFVTRDGAMKHITGNKCFWKHVSYYKDKTPDDMLLDLTPPEDRDDDAAVSTPVNTDGDLHHKVPMTAPSGNTVLVYD